MIEMSEHFQRLMLGENDDTTCRVISGEYLLVCRQVDDWEADFEVFHLMTAEQVVPQVEMDGDYRIEVYDLQICTLRSVRDGDNQVVGFEMYRGDELVEPVKRLIGNSPFPWILERYTWPIDLRVMFFYGSDASHSRVPYTYPLPVLAAIG